MTHAKLLKLERLIGDYNLEHDLTVMQSRQVMNVLRLVIRDRRIVGEDVSTAQKEIDEMCSLSQ